MKHKSAGQKPLSVFALKQALTRLLAGALADCGLDIVLGFESSFNSRICTLRFEGSRRVALCVNLSSVEKVPCIRGASPSFRVQYCAGFVAEYLKQIQRAGNALPKSYFEGLVFLNAAEVRTSEKTVAVHSPLSHWQKGPKPSLCLRPLEISSAINTLNRLRLFSPQSLSEQEQSAIRAICEDLLLYAGLPEVSYANTGVPVYTLAHAFRRLAALMDRDPGLAQAFPVLALAPFAQIRQLTVSDLLLHCKDSDNAFLTGVAVRLMAFFLPPRALAAANDLSPGLAAALKDYLDYGCTYCSEVSATGRGLLRDNRRAVQIAMKSINQYFTLYGAGTPAGNVHSIG